MKMANLLSKQLYIINIIKCGTKLHMLLNYITINSWRKALKTISHDGFLGLFLLRDLYESSVNLNTML